MKLEVLLYNHYIYIGSDQVVTFLSVQQFTDFLFYISTIPPSISVSEEQVIQKRATRP